MKIVLNRLPPVAPKESVSFRCIHSTIFLETVVLRHSNNRKWYAIVMRVSRRKFGFDSDEVIDVVNLKLPTEMFGSFSSSDGVYPAYHMNKLHWISVLLPDAPDDVVKFLVNVSFEAAKTKKKARNERIAKS